MADNQVILNADVVFDATKIQQRFAQLERNLKFQSPFGNMARDTKSFAGELDRATTRVITLGTAFSVLATASRLLRGVVDSTIAVEKSLTSVNTIFRLTTDNLNKFSSSLFDISRDTATSFEKVAEAAQEFARQGLSVAETQKAVRAALMLSRDANIDVAESVKAITAATNSFNKEALSRLQIVNRLASVDAAFAVSSKDLSEALIRTGSAAADAGVSFNQFIGLVTAAQQISQRGGSVIAGALNTIFTRVNRRDTLDALDSLGVAITDVRGQALPTIQVLQNFAVAYDKMTGSIKNQAAELVGGVRQLNTLKATLKDLATEGSVFAQVQDVIARSSNELERRNAARNQTIAAQVAQIGTTARQVGANFGNVGLSGNIKPLLSSALNNPLVQAFSEANGSAESAGGKAAELFMKGFGSAVIFGLGPILIRVLGAITTQVTGNLLKDVQAITGLNSAEKERLAIEADIVAVYKAGGVALQQQLASMNSLAERAALVRGLMSGTGAGVTSASSIAGELIGSGYKRTRRIPGMAGGYIPYAEEMAAVNAGVGGATPGSRPVLLNNFNFGGGRVGQIVANTSEYVVPNFAGGSAIFNRDMVQKMGLPPGAKPIAAGGFIPNAAESWLHRPDSPLTAYEAALKRLGPLEAEARKIQQVLPTLAANAAISGMGSALPYGPAAPTAAQWRSMGGRPEDRYAKEFSKAQEELARMAKEETRLAKQRLQQIETAFKTAEEEAQLRVKKTGLTKAEVALGEKRLAEYHAQQTAAREELTAAFNLQKQIAAAPIFRGTRIDAEIRPVLMGQRSPYQVTNEGLVSLRGTGATGMAAASAAMSSSGNLSAADTERIKKVYRQEMVEAKRAARQGEIAAQNKRIDRLRERLAEARLPDPYSGDFIGPRTPVGWIPPSGPPPMPPAGPSLWSRINAKAGSTGGTLGLGLGLPFLGGLISEGKGGTSEGVWRGAATNGLQMAGSGAMIGGAFGPAGVLPGLAIGAVLGGLYGAINKASKSFEELSLELDQKSKKLTDELSTASNVLRLQSELKDAILSDNQEQVMALKQQQASERAKITNPKYLDIISRYLDNPEEGQVQLARTGSPGLAANAVRSNLMTSMGRGKLGMMDVIGKFFGSDPLNKQMRESGVDSIASAIGQLSNDQLQDLGAVAKKDPVRALTLVGQLAGMNASDIQSMVEPMQGRGPSSSTARDLTQTSIGGAVARLLLREKAPVQQAELVVNRERELLALAAKYRGEASFAGITGGANSQIAQVRQQIALSNPMLTDIGRLSMQGTFGAQNIRAQINTQRSATLLEGQSKLIELANAAGGPAAFTERIKNLRSLSDVEAFSKDLSTREGRASSGLISATLGTDKSQFRKELEDLATQMRVLNKTEQENTRANNEGNRLMMEELLLSKTAAGAQREVTGAFFNTRQGLESAINRRDPLETIEAARAASRAADLNAMRFHGLLNDQQYGSSLLNLESDTNYGRNLRSFQYAQGRGSGRRMSDLMRDRDLDFAQRSMSFRDLQGLGTRRRVDDLMRDQNLAMEERIMANRDATAAGFRNFDPEELTRQRRIEGFNLEAQRRVSLGLGYSEGQSRLDMARYAARLTRQSRFTSGSQQAAADFGVAQERGLQGDALGSLSGGFHSVFAGLKRDISDFADVGKAVADSLNQSLGNAFGDFVTGAKSGKDAFRGFAVSVLSDASRMLASKAISSILGSFLGGPAGATGGEFTGSSFHLASGGLVPAMLTGGEYVVGPNAARRIGYDTLRRMNGLAEGGIVRGGSGVKDDVPARLAPGSFVIKQSSTNRIGPDYLDALVHGKVQHRFVGGILSALFGSTLSGAISGAVIGGGLGYLTGGKKGAIGGALLGGIGGGLYGGQYIGPDAATITSAGGATLSVGQKIALGLGASAGLGLLAAGISQRKEGPGPLKDSQLPAYRKQLEAAQATTFGQRTAPYPILQVGPQGQQYIAGFTTGPATRRWATGGPVNTAYAMPPMLQLNGGGGVNAPLTMGAYTAASFGHTLPAMRSFSKGGGVDVPLTVGMARNQSGSNSPTVSVKIEINNNGTATASSSASGGQDGAFQGDFANKLQKMVQGAVQQELVNQSRPDGFFTQRGRYLQR